MGWGLRGLIYHFLGEFFLGLTCKPFVYVLLLDVHGLLVEFKLLLVGANAVEELSVTRA